MERRHTSPSRQLPTIRASYPSDGHRLATTPDLLHGDSLRESTKPNQRASTSPIRKESSITPVRIVFDCSFHSSPNSPSLNDCLLTVPPFLNDMCAILLRFRTFIHGLSTDIEKAFLHVGLHHCDRDFTTIIDKCVGTNMKNNNIF